VSGFVQETVGTALCQQCGHGIQQISKYAVVEIALPLTEVQCVVC